MTRMTLDLTPEQATALEALVTDLGAASKAEALRRAIALTRTVTEFRKAGFQLLAEKEGEKRLIVFP